VDRAVPRCLGLTASYANDRATTWEDFLESRRSLQVAKHHTGDFRMEILGCFSSINWDLCSGI
jgi:hypothetical protein